MKRFAALAASAALITMSGAAAAQAGTSVGIGVTSGLPAQGTFALSGERLTGIFFEKVAIDPDNGEEVETSATTISLFGNGGSGLSLFNASPGTTPRFGFDYFVAENVSIGGGLLYWTRSGETEDDAGNDADLSEVTVFALAPRAGYALGLSDSIYLWLRGGFTWLSYNEDADGGGETSATLLTLDLEAQFVFGIADGFGVTAGPLVNFPLTGSYETDLGAVEFDGDLSYQNFGIAAGLVGWL